MPAGSASPTTMRHAMPNPEQPARDRCASTDGRRPVGQNEENRLKRILRIVRIAKNAAADTQHHRAVSEYQLF